MRSLRELPPNVVSPIGADDVSALRGQAEALGQRCLYADCSQAHDAQEVLDRLGCGLSLPDYYGANLDALYDCLTDFEPLAGAAEPGIVLMIENLPGADGWRGRQRTDLLAVFRDAAAEYAARGIAFRVLYSVRKTSA